jgi:hypothetical protein
MAKSKDHYDPETEHARTSTQIEVKRVYDALKRAERHDLASKVRSPQSNMISRGDPPQIQAARDAAKQAARDGDLDDGDLRSLAVGRLRW